MYGSEAIIWKEKERSRIRAIQMENLRGLLGTKRMDKVQNPLVKELGGDERIDEAVFQWFRNVDRMESNKTANMMYVKECAGSRSEGWPQKRWIDTV